MTEYMQTQQGIRIASAATAVAKELRIPTPVFDYRILWSPTYESLFEGVFVGETGIDALLDVARVRGRVLLSSEGGTGKSIILRHLFRRAADLSMIPVLVDLNDWTPPMFDVWTEYADSDVTRMELLLQEVGRPSVSEVDLAVLPADLFRPILVDGLNELPRTLSAQILHTLDGFCQRNPGAGCIVGDRLIRRAFAARPWELATVALFDQELIARLLPGADAAARSNELLRRAFYLNLAVTQGLQAAEGPETFATYLREHVDLTELELDLLGETAFRLYKTEKARTFPLAILQDAIGNELVQKLRQSGLILESGDRAYFQHHLYHDYLTSHWLAGHPDSWTRKVFDIASFQASSFDVLALTLQQIRVTESADELLRKIYDWNFYASAYALAKGRAFGDTAASAEMEVALLAMLAERRWDPIEATAQGVTDALRLFPGELARELLAATDLKEVQRIVSRQSFVRDEFEAWRALFLYPADEPVPDKVLTMVGGAESLLGWTAANVLRRVSLTSKQQARLRSYLRDRDPTVRWRAAHSLGAYPSTETLAALIERLRDTDGWVQYGAIRAVIEIAAGEPRVRTRAFRLIQDNLDFLRMNPHVLRELERAVLLREPPTDWAKAVEPIIEELWASAPTPEDHDRWRQLAFNIERRVGSASVESAHAESARVGSTR